MKNLEAIQELIEAKQQLQRVLGTDNPSIIAMRTRQSIKHIDQAAFLLDTKTLKPQDPIVGSESLINTIVDEVNRTIKDQLLELIREEKSQDPIVESVVSKLRSRSSVGIKKYGKTLADNNLSFLEWVKHAQEEQMDNVNYLETILQNGIKKQKQYIEELLEIADSLDSYYFHDKLEEIADKMIKDLENLGVKFNDQDL